MQVLLCCFAFKKSVKICFGANFVCKVALKFSLFSSLKLFAFESTWLWKNVFSTFIPIFVSDLKPYY